jgi:phage protein D
VRRSEPIILVHLKTKQVAPKTSGGHVTIPGKRAQHTLDILALASNELTKAAQLGDKVTVAQLNAIMSMLKAETGNPAFNRFTSVDNVQAMIRFEVAKAKKALAAGTTIVVIPQPQPDPVDITQAITSFSYEDDEKKTDMLTLVVTNHDLAYFDTPLFDKGTTMIVSWGYVGAMSPPREVIVTTIKGARSLTVEAHGKATLMNKEAKVRTFENVTRAEVVRTLANENGYGPEKQDIDDSPVPDRTVARLQAQVASEASTADTAAAAGGHRVKALDTRVAGLRRELARALAEAAKAPPRSPGDVVRYPVITQSGLTDAQFLKRLADLQGYEFYVDFDGLHWHPRRFGQRPIKKLTYYVAPGVGEVIDFSVESDLTAKVGQVVAKGRDPIAKTDITTTANNEETPRDALGSSAMAIDPMTGEALGHEHAASATGTTPAEPTAAGAKKEAAGQFVRSQQASTLLTLELVGDPDLVAKTIVEVAGLGKRLSGKYYVSSIKHTIEPGKVYTMSLKLRSDGTNMGAVTPGAAVRNDQKAPDTSAASSGELTEHPIVNSMTGEVVVTYTDTRGRGSDATPKGD